MISGGDDGGSEEAATDSPRGTAASGGGGEAHPVSNAIPRAMPRGARSKLLFMGLNGCDCPFSSLRLSNAGSVGDLF